MDSTIKLPTKAKAIYSQIEGRLRHKIRQQEWPTGSMLPSRRDLAKEYGVSSLTIDRAVTRLIAEGLLRADDRRGTFVTGAVASVSAQTDAGAAWRRDDLPGSRGVARHQVVGTVASLYPERTPGHLELNNFWVRLLLRSMEHELSERGRTNRFFNRVPAGGGRLTSIREAISAQIAEGVDALVVVALGIDPGELDRELSVLDDRDVPVVCVTSGELRRPITHLFYENRGAGYKAAEHLIQRGCTEIVFLSPFRASWVEERLLGVLSAAEHAGLPADAVQLVPADAPHWIQEEDPGELGYRAGRAAIAEGQIRSGVICANDGVAFGFLRAASEAGLEPGRDFRLVGFDDHEDARIIGLSSLRPPMDLMGKEAARLVSRVLNGEKTESQVRFQSNLISRTTTGMSLP